MARACLDASVEHARQRRQFGVRIGDHQLVRGLLADMAVRVHAAEALCWQAAEGAERGSTMLEVNLAKHYAAQAANDAARAAVQVHGAAGVCALGPVERHFRDAKILELIEGSNEIQALLIGQALLDGLAP